MADEQEVALRRLRETLASDMEEEKKKLTEEQKESLEELREKLEKEKEMVSEIIVWYFPTEQAWINQLISLDGYWFQCYYSNCC